MTKATSIIASAIASFIGMSVTSAKDNGAVFKIAELSDKLGSLKSGEKAEYVALHNVEDNTVVVMMHPRTAVKLFKNGEADGFTLIPVEAVAVQESAVDETALQAELTDVQAGVEEKDPAEVEVKVTNKQKAINIFNEEKAKLNGDTGKALRAPVIARFKSEIGMGNPGASTYYQNCKGSWAA